MTHRLLLTLTAVTFLTTHAWAQDEDVQDLRDARKAKRAMPVAKSITGINLLHVTEENVGIAISYERFLKNTNNVSIYLPLSFALPQNEWDSDEPVTYGGNYGYYANATAEASIRSNGTAYFCPGIKVYPGGAHKKVSYALGTSLVFGVGMVEETTRTFNVDTLYQGGNTYYQRTVKSKKSENVMQFKTGFMVTNSLNLRPTDKLYLGVELGVGYSYLNLQDGVSNNRGALVQAGIKIGYVN